jgi:parallel beta-helix repeat protein
MPVPEKPKPKTKTPMKMNRILQAGALFSLALGPAAHAATAEVTKSGSNYIVKVDGAQTLSTTDYATALQNAAGTGNRTMNVRVHGDWKSQVRMRTTSSFNYLTASYSYGSASTPALYSYKSGGIQINGLILFGYSTFGIRLSSCASPRITNTTVDCRNTTQPAVAIRIDSEGSTRTTGCYARTVKVFNMVSGDKQGFETYSIDGYDLSGMEGSSLGGCGVLINDGRSGTIGTAKSYDCGKGTTYAGLRFANNCDGATVSDCNASSSARGLFILNSANVTVNKATISGCRTDSIWIQYGSNDRVSSGSVTSSPRPVITSSPGSSINVSYTP